ncbi:TonB-dependent receptor [Massilia violaceinigra]|uniref:TonB-dependent receptor n=1 Tax=Massilia violaceinigra TaxID=2045208 RepID=A0ABY4A2P4_9BURK|nr:TonB-dependent receptor [Massilia violaceinigra]UOD29027.1 TonB-dependent receptor [Massilia violaceinigra]
MNVQRTLLASAILSALSTLNYANAQAASAAAGAAADAVVPKVIVTANPFGKSEGDQILTPTKILAGDELRDKLGGSLGETLSNELGVSASGFGAGASRPIIRGLEGSRVKMLENGMAVADVSGLSNDHAVSADGAVARQIEILRGPAALLYGSGAIGGLVNVVNERIPTALEDKPAGQLETRYGTVDKGRSASGSLDGAVGNIGLHIDGNIRRSDDYKIPDSRVLNDPSSSSGRLPQSFTRQDTLGAGASLIGDWGHAGVSVSSLNNRYGIPTLEGSQIDQSQMRYDLDTLLNKPFAGVETIKFKLGYTDYEHAELDDENKAEVIFANRALETRAELTHAPLAGWHGTVGMQTENAHFSALSGEGGPDTVPVTHSTSNALFVVEERDFGPVRVNAGARLESVKRRPLGNVERKFDLGSYSAGAQWPFTPGYSMGATVSVAQRAPATEELYSGGPHDATATFDIGNADFKKETSRNIELSLQKVSGLVRWKANVFQNKVKDFIYGNINGTLVDEEGNPGEELLQRVYQQADASIRGAEAEVTYNQHGEGLSLRGFADTSRGKLDHGGSLPLQPATRIGVDAGYRSGPLRAGLSVVRAQTQDRLASFEQNATPAYTQVSANVAYTQRMGSFDLTWFMIARNLLNEDIRLSTSVLKDVSPLPGRNFLFGVRTKF